jgi:hypothetical protein
MTAAGPLEMCESDSAKRGRVGVGTLAAFAFDDAIR